MAQPASRQDLITYCKRQLGAPVLEINVADEQIEDLVDDAIQYFHERHFDGVIQTFLHYKITEDDINRGKGPGTSGVSWNHDNHGYGKCWRNNFNLVLQKITTILNSSSGYWSK